MAAKPQKESRQLRTAKGKRVFNPSIAVDSIGSWNPDASESDMPQDDLAEMRNMRKMKRGEIEVRSGFSQWFVSGTKIPLCVAEYRIDNVAIVMVFVKEGSVIKCVSFNQLDHSMVETQIFVCGANPVVCAYQMQTYMFVSVVKPAWIVAGSSPPG